MCSMIYDQPHHQQLDMTMMASSSDKTPPSFGVGIGQTTTVRQPSVGLAVPVNTGKENSGNCIGVPAGNIPASAPGAGVESIVDDGELRLEVTCGQNQAFLYTGRLQLGSKGTCVLFENAWLTPNEFQYVSGRETAKDWKRSIKHHGKSLKVLIAKGILTTSPPARCDCGQCNSSPRKPNSVSDCAAFTAPSSVDCPKLSTSDCSEVWRSGVHGAPTADGNSTTSGSAFRPPPDVASSTGAYRNPDCALAGDLSTVGDDAFGSRSMSKSSHHQQSSVEHSHSGSITSSSSSPDARSKKSSSGGAAKRPRSPSADSSLDHPPSKHQLLDGTGHHSSESSSGRGEHQSRLGYESSSSRSHQRQQFSPSADGGSQRRRDQSQPSSSSNGQCRSSQSGSFKSPSVPAHHHHYQNGGSGSQQQASSSQKSSPATGITASTGGVDRSHVGLSTDPSCVISPLAATPYFPFLAAAAAATSTAAQLPTTPVCYPNPYMMLPLAAAAAAYQNPSAAQFPSPYGWNSAAASVASSVADASRLTSGNMSVASNGPAFDFPWMRGGGCASQTAANNGYASKLSPTPPSMMGDPYELAKQSSTFGMSSAAQNPYAYRGGSGSAAAAAGFGGLFAAAADQLDAYDNYLRSSFKVATPHLTSAAAAAAAGFQQSLFDGQHNAAAAAAGFGVYPPLFQSPYFGIPSR